MAENETHFAVWFHSTCPPECSIRGTCTLSGNSTGECSCLSGDFVGLDCYTGTEFDVFSREFKLISVITVLEGFSWKLLILVFLGAALVGLGSIGGCMFFCLQESRPVFRGGYETIQ